MYNQITEIDNISSKIQKVFSTLELDDHKNVNDISTETNIDLTELKDLLNIMSKSEYIEQAGNEEITMTQYGFMIKDGKINTGYAPI